MPYAPPPVTLACDHTSSSPAPQEAGPFLYCVLINYQFCSHFCDSAVSLSFLKALKVNCCLKLDLQSPYSLLLTPRLSTTLP